MNVFAAIRFFVWLTSFYLLGLQTSVAKLPEDAIELLTIEKLEVNMGLNTLELQLNNHSDVSMEGELRIEVPLGLEIIGSSKIQYQIKPKKKKFLSIKFRGENIASLKDAVIKIAMFDASKTLISTQAIQLIVPPRRSVNLSNESHFQYLKQVGDSIRLAIRILNNGTTDERVKLIFSSADRVGDVKFHAFESILLAGHDSLVNFSFQVEKFMLNRQQYAVQVTGLYENNDVFSTMNIDFSNIVSSRNYNDLWSLQNQQHVFKNNFIQLQMDNILNEQQSYIFRSAGEYDLASMQMNYQLNLTKFQDQAPLSYNSYINLNKGPHELLIGNIQESLEASVYGRGIAYTMQGHDNQQSFAVGLVQRSYDLLNLTGNSTNGYATYLRWNVLDEEKQRNRYDGQFIFDRNYLDSTRNFLWSNSFDILRNKTTDSLKIYGFAAVGLQHYLGSSSLLNDYYPAAAVGVKLEKRFKDWMIVSDNFYSNPYYTGNRKGMLRLNERVIKRFGQSSFSLGYALLKYNPHYFTAQFLNLSNTSSIIDMTFNTMLNKRFSVSLVPSYKNEFGQYNSLRANQFINTNSWRMVAQSNWRSMDMKHQFNLMMESAYYLNDQSTGNKYAWLSNLSYSFKNLQFTGSYQDGPMSIYDLLSSNMFGATFQKRLFAGVNYSGTVNAQKLNWRTSSNFNYNFNFGKSIHQSIDLNYKVFKHTELTVQGVYNINSYRKNQFQYASFRVGVRQALPNPKKPSIKQLSGDLNVFCFYDQNNNEIFDEGDELAENISFSVNNYLLITDKDGKASFNKLPYAEYSIFVPRKDQYMAIANHVEINSKNRLLNLPLQKGGTVKGKLEMTVNPGISLEVDSKWNNYLVIAEHENGKTFSNVADKDGTFQFNLPIGNYRFYIDETSLPPNVYWEGKPQQGIVHIERSLSLPTFTLKVKTKTLEVRRFSAK